MACHNASEFSCNPPASFWGVCALVLHSCPASGHNAPLGNWRLPAYRCSSNSDTCHCVPSNRNCFARCTVARTPSRVIRDSTLLSGDTCVAKMPAGKPEAPAPKFSPWSKTSTVQPRLAKLYATAAPDKPEPMTTACLLAASSCRCVSGEKLGRNDVLGVHCGWYTPL